MNCIALSDEQIDAVIKDYLRDSVYQYAIMLDGDWGSGKSYYVDNRLKALLKDESRSLIYVSLYGVKSMQEINTEILLQYAISAGKKAIKENKKIGSVLEKLGGRKAVRRAGDVGKVAGKRFFEMAESYFGDGIGDILEIKEHLEELFFVFDDLERCSAPINEVLGYLNKWIEHSGAKVLIVANERECGRAVSQQQELQLISAAMLREYMPKHEKDNGYSRVRDMKEEVTLGDIQHYADKIFGRDDLYGRTKEKLIGRTIRYEVRLEDTAPVIVAKVFGKENADKKCVQEIARACVDGMKQEGISNLRIMQSALSGYKKYYEIIDGLDISSEAKYRVIYDTMNSMMRVSIRAQTKGPRWDWDISWKGEAEVDTVSCLPDNHVKLGLDSHELGRCLFTSFRFVHQYVSSGVVQYDEATRGISEYGKRVQREIDKENSAWGRLTDGYWNFTEAQMKETVMQMEREFLNNEYPESIWLKVIETSSTYHEVFGIGNPDVLCDFVVQRAQESWIDADMSRWEFNETNMTEATKQRLSRCVDQIQRAKHREDIKALSKILNRYDEESWSEAFNDLAYNQEMKSRFMVKECFAGAIDIDGLLNAIEKGNSKDLRSVVKGVGFIYSGDVAHHFRGDYRAIKRLKNGLERMSIDDGIKRLLRDNLCEVLSVFIKALDALK